jgi:hypothetical protein
MSPHDSDDLTEIIEEESGGFVALRSSDSAEHRPDYQELGRFLTREEAQNSLDAR